MTVTGFCAGCAGRRGLVVTSLLSLFSCAGVLGLGVYCLVSEETGWNWVRDWFTTWLSRNHWDLQFTESVWRLMAWIDLHHQFLLAGLVLLTSLHLASTLLLVLGTILLRPALLLPWIITDFILILLLIVLFISWTFLSFFVDLLIAIVFPVLAGLLLGLWIVLWRNAYRFFRRKSAAEKLMEADTDNEGLSTLPRSVADSSQYKNR